MGIYAQVEDCTDPSFTVNASHLDGADVFVDLSLRERGFNPAEITLPNAILKAIAVAWAKSLAANEAARGEQSVLISKAKQYENNAKTLVEKLNRAALGLQEPVDAGGFSSFGLGRG